MTPLLSVKISAALLLAWTIFNAATIFFSGIPENWIESKLLVYGGVVFAIAVSVFGILGRKGTSESLGKWKSFPTGSLIASASFVFCVVMEITKRP